jgi:recombination protein RecR
MFPLSIQKLIDALQDLPGVGPKTAERYVFHLLKYRDENLASLAQTVFSLKRGLHECQNCFNFAEHDLCSICKNPQRDGKILCVVADCRDLVSLEKSGQFHGRYFVLGGLLDPLSGVTPEDLHFTELKTRLQNPLLSPDELIIGFSPNIEGETTLLYLKELLKPYSVHLTRLARGLPNGADLEYADPQTLTEAIAGRREV